MVLGMGEIDRFLEQWEMGRAGCAPAADQPTPVRKPLESGDHVRVPVKLESFSISGYACAPPSLIPNIQQMHIPPWL